MKSILLWIAIALALAMAPLHGDIVVGDETISVVFSDEGTLQTVSAGKDRPLTTEPVGLIPFAITLRPGNGEEFVTIPDDDVTFTGGGKWDDGRMLSYDIPKHGLAVQLMLKMHAPGVVRWRLDVTNKSGVRTWSVEFPRIEKVRIGDDHEDDVMIYPGSGGAFYVDKRFFRRRQFSHRSGGGLTLGWMDLYDEENGGFFVADVNPVKKLFSLNADAMSNRNRAWDMSTTRYVTIGKGETVGSVALTGAHAGDWHAAADVYRDWYYKHFPVADYPEWAVNCPGWMHRPLSQGDDEPRATFDHYLRDGFDRARYYGTRFMGIWGNNTDIQPCGLFHYPSIRMGGPESVAKAMNDIRKKGARATFYINAYRYSYEYGSKDFVGYCSKEALPDDLPYEDKQWVLDRALRDAKGELVGPTGTNYKDYQGIARMDYNSLGWQRHMLDTVRRHAEWGVTLYLDESGASAKPNYATIPDPMLPGHENYALGMLNFLKEAHKAASKHIDGYALAGERYYELYAPYIAFQTDGRFGPFVEAILYTHPSHLLPLYHRAVPRNYEWVEKFRRAFVRGQPILFMGESGRKINLLASSVIDLTRYRHGAVFRDNVGLEVTGSGEPGLLDPHSSKTEMLMRVKRWDVAGDDRRVTTVNFHNYKANPGLGIVVEPGELGEVKHAFLYTIENMVQAIPFETLDDGRVAVSVPPVHVGSVVLVGRESDEKAIRMTAWFDRSGDDPMARDIPDAIRVGLVNAGDVRRRVRLSVKADGPLTVKAPETVELDPGEARRLRLRITNLDAIQRLTEVDIAVTGGPVNVTKTAFVMPPVANRSFEVDDNGDNVPDNWLGPIRLDTAQKTHGKAAGKLSWDNRLPMTARVNPANPDEPMPLYEPAGEGSIRAVNYMYLKPGRTYRVSCDFRAEKYVGRSWAALRLHAVGSGSNAVLHQETVLRSPLAGAILTEMRPRPQWYDGKWRRLVAYITTPADMEQARIELVQHDSPEPVWFDNVRVEEVTAPGVSMEAGHVVDDSGVVKEEAWYFMCDACGQTLRYAYESEVKKRRADMPAKAGQGGACPACGKAAFFAAEYCPKCRKAYIPTIVKTPEAPEANDFCPHCKSWSPTGGDQ